MHTEFMFHRHRTTLVFDSSESNTYDIVALPCADAFVSAPLIDLRC